MDLKSLVRNIPDFPVPGIQFKDLTTAFKDPEALQIMTQAMVDLYRDKGVTRVVGIEARGFIGGAILLSLGVIGEYIGKIYREVKRRPRYHIEKTV